MAEKAKKNISFEGGLERLEGIANQMESGELALDKLLKLYEEGMKLSAELTKKLDEAQGRMQEVHLGRDGLPVMKPSEVAQQESMLDNLDAREEK